MHARIPPAIKVTRPADEIKELTAVYACERDPRVKKRMELVLDRCDGLPVGETAQVERVSRNTPTNWVKRFNAEGIGGLRDRPRTGPVPKMSKGTIDKVALASPRAFGYKQQAWTLTLLWHALMDVCNVVYSKGRLSVILALLEYRRVVPRTESVAASKAKQEAWRAKIGACLLEEFGTDLWCEDEETSRLETVVKKVLTKKGHKPVVRVKVGNYDQKVNIFISWHAKDGLVVVTFEDSLDAETTIRHLRLLKKIHGKGPLHLLWDGTGAHGDEDVLRQAKKLGIHFHRFPTHSPKMNPVEEINRQLKRFLATKLFKNREDLLAEVKRFFDEHHCKFALALASYIGPKSATASQ